MVNLNTAVNMLLCMFVITDMLIC